MKHPALVGCVLALWLFQSKCGVVLSETPNRFFAHADRLGVLCRLEQPDGAPAPYWQNRICGAAVHIAQKHSFANSMRSIDQLTLTDTRRLQPDRITLVLHGRLAVPDTDGGVSMLVLSLSLYRPLEARVEPRLFAVAPGAIALREGGWMANAEAVHKILRKLIFRALP